jgi:3',5'-cyclic AMP phosphodiesterase CpdA
VLGREPLRVFAVEPDAIQVDWRRLTPGPHVVTAGRRSVEVQGEGAPGAVRIDGLPPGTALAVALDGRTLTVTSTLAPPPGPPVARVATLSDLHLGETAFGHLPRHHSNLDPAQAHPVVCLRAALAEIAEWDPDLLVLKGDLAEDNSPAQYELLAEALDEFHRPVVLLRGNHDGGNHHHPGAAVALERLGLELVSDVHHVDLLGLRVVAADSVWPDRNQGRLTPHLDALTEALSGAPGPALLATHHQFMRTRLPTYAPAGILGPEANVVLDAIAEANPATLVTSGHSHRHRARRHGPLVVTEVGSPKDHPGTWGAYMAYPTGIVQVVRRVADPDAIRWTERTASVLFGAWGRWSPGLLRDRCFVHLWP